MLLFYLFQLKIQFDDALTSTYEYPSEASLLDDQSITSWTSSTSTSESNDNLKSETDSVISHSSNSNSSLSTLKSNLAFGGSSGN